MARPNKIGLDYFPFDVGYFEDDKIQLIEAEFGVKGGYIAVRLLCKIYREGYFYQWGGDECLLFAKNAGAEFVPNTVDEVVKGLVRRCFFDKGCFDRFGILTSKGIQKRYFEAAKRNKTIEVFEEYLLIDTSEYDNVTLIPVSATETAINAAEMQQKKRKENKIKENKINVAETEKIKNQKNDFDYSFVENDFKQPFDDWLEYKKARKEKYSTQKSLEVCYKQLKELSGGRPETAKKIVEKSMANGWKGLFELKNQKNDTNSRIFVASCDYGESTIHV